MPTYFAALPAYFVIVFGVHAYAQSMLMGSSNPRAYNNANPRAAGNTAAFQKALGPKAYSKWERARAAHQNGLESFPLFAVTLLVLHVAGWHEGGLTGTSSVAWVNVVGRAIYTALFVNTESRRPSYWRSAAWTITTVTNLVALTAAALKA